MEGRDGRCVGRKGRRGGRRREEGGEGATADQAGVTVYKEFAYPGGRD